MWTSLRTVILEEPYSPTQTTTKQISLPSTCLICDGVHCSWFERTSIPIVEACVTSLMHQNLRVWQAAGTVCMKYNWLMGSGAQWPVYHLSPFDSNRTCLYCRGLAAAKTASFVLPPPGHPLALRGHKHCRALNCAETQVRNGTHSKTSEQHRKLRGCKSPGVWWMHDR